MRNFFSKQCNTTIAQALAADTDDFSSYSTVYNLKTHSPQYTVARGKCMEVMVEVFDNVSNNLGRSKVSFYISFGAILQHC